MALFKSTGIFKRITDISIDYLKDNDINTLLLDVDNTLSTHHGKVLVEGLREWLDLMIKNSIGWSFKVRRYFERKILKDKF